MRNIYTISIMAVIFLFSSFAVHAAIDLAPVAEGTSGKVFYNITYSTISGPTYNYNTTFSTYTSINGVPNYTSHNTSVSTYTNIGPFIQAGRFSSVTSTSTYSTTTFIQTQVNLKGVVEFDISSLSALTGPFSATLRLDYNGRDFNSTFARTLSLYDMAESAEDGAVTTGEVKGAKITDIFTLPAGGGGPSAGFYNFNVTSALVADLANIGTNSYSGFMIDFDLADPSFPFDSFFDVTPGATFNNYDGGGSEGPKLIINTNPVPEPSSLMLIGAGLLGLYFTNRKINKN